jgi:hypothetical protein
MKLAMILLTALSASCLALTAAVERPYPPMSASNPPFLRLRIAVPERGNVVARDDYSHFHVVIENISDRAQKIIDEGNSWGYSNLRFEYVTAAGQKIVMEKQRQEWSKNFQSITTLQPGEVMVRDVYLNDIVWSNLPVPQNNGANVNVRLQAIFEQKPESGIDAWQGQITSPEIAITFSNRRSK